MNIKCSQHIGFVLLFLLACTACRFSTDSSREYHILVIQSYEKHFPAYREMNKILAGKLQKKGIRASIHIFYLDCEQYTEKQQKQKVFYKLDILTEWEPDIILVNDDPALNALLSSNHPAVKSVPVIFMGVSYPNVPFIRKHPNITGFSDKPDYRANIELIRQLIGNCIVIRVTDNTLEDKQILSDMDNRLKGVCAVNRIFSTDRVRLSGKNGISIREIPKIKPDSVYIGTLYAKSTGALMKEFGENYYNKAFLATKRDYTTISLGRLSAFPCFSVINDLISYNDGIAGGYVTAFSEQAGEATNRIADILNGAPVSSFPQIQESRKTYIFDYKILRKWDIDFSRLPAGSTIVNMPFTVRYSYFLWGGTALLAIVLSVIFSCQRKQYKRVALHKKEVQEKLKHEKAFLSFALESGNIFAFRYTNGVFEFDNRFYYTLGIPVKQITVDEFLQMIHPEDQREFWANLDKLDKGFLNRQITRHRYDFNRKGYEWWEFRYAQSKRQEDTLSRNENIEISGLCLNIQQIKETEYNLMSALQKAEESDRMKSVFLANMSHEIRTPLNAIVGFSQLLNSDMELSPEEKAEFIDLITKNSDLLLKLINDILDLSRIESGCFSFSYANTDLTKLIEDIFHTHQLMMPENVELRKRVPADSIVINVDRFRLTQVCTNFINNARKFTTKGYIEIGYELSADNRFVFISVTDTGKGIPEEKKALVFERFQKLDEFAQGTGLGLAICMSIVKVFNGNITLESTVGQGSKFTISLPYTPGLEV